MASSTTRKPQLKCHPLTPDRWDDFVQLFGRSGAYGGCWCMWWRITRKQFEAQGNQGNRRAMQRIVRSGEVPGLLGYLRGVPVAWCSVARRESYASLNRSRVLRPVDDRPVWSIVCFFIAKEQRGKGLTAQLIEAAIDYVRAQGGRIVEAYPTRPRQAGLPAVSSYMGLPSTFERLGFVECARPSEAKRILRYEIRSAPSS